MINKHGVNLERDYVKHKKQELTWEIEFIVSELIEQAKENTNILRSEKDLNQELWQELRILSERKLSEYGKSMRPEYLSSQVLSQQISR